MTTRKHRSYRDPRIALASWGTVEGIIDYVHGAETDSGYLCSVQCPKCGGTHLVTVSRIGRFLYHCNECLVYGDQGLDWRTKIALVKKEGSCLSTSGEPPESSSVM